jgi:hypothetical protein
MTNSVSSATAQVTTAPGLISQILNTLLNPAAAMAAVPQQSGRHFWLLAVQLLLTTAIVYWFYAGMSPAWLVEQQLLHAGELTPAETEQIRAAMASMAGATPIIGAVSVAVGSLAFTAITAGLSAVNRQAAQGAELRPVVCIGGLEPATGAAEYSRSGIAGIAGGQPGPADDAGELRLAESVGAGFARWPRALYLG